MREKAQIKMGILITFEGIEGCGKTTQARMAGKDLSRKGIPHIVTEEPGATNLGKRLRGILLNRSAFAFSPEAELFLFLADRAQHVKEVITPAMQENKVVLCDRFADATIAYQGFGRSLDREIIRKMNRFSCGGLKPELTFLFDLPVEAGLARAMKRMSELGQDSREDRFEKEQIEFHKRVREGYHFLARREPGRFRIIDGTRDIVTIHRDVMDTIMDLVGRYTLSGKS
ncbi:MAG: dTMP kinase [Syntrophales bacterium]